MKVLMVSLGCDKNLVDSEVMLGLLHKAGHEITNDEHEAEAVLQEYRPYTAVTGSR